MTFDWLEIKKNSTNKEIKCQHNWLQDVAMHCCIMTDLSHELPHSKLIQFTYITFVKQTTYDRS